MVFNFIEAFHLDFNTGILYPKRSLLGILKQFKLTVEVTDGRFTDKAVIDVNVLDVNQNKPLFQEPSSSNASVLIPEVCNSRILSIFIELSVNIIVSLINKECESKLYGNESIRGR